MKNKNYLIKQIFYNKILNNITKKFNLVILIINLFCKKLIKMKNDNRIIQV
jgi:hypothetical protein